MAGSPLKLTDTDAVREFSRHADYRTATAFTIGLVTLLSLRFLLLATDCTHKWNSQVWSRLLHLVSDPTPQDSEKSDHQRTTTASTGQKVEIWSTPDPYHALAFLNSSIVLWSLTFLGTTLLFPTASPTGCGFLGAWSTLTFQASRILCFAILGLNIRSEIIGASVYELYVLLTYLAIRIVFTIATAAVSVFRLQPLPQIKGNLCQMKSNVALGATVDTLDLVFTLLMLGRLWTATVLGENGHSNGGWRIWIRALLTRQVAKCLTILLWIVSGFAGATGTTNFAGSWIPVNLALLLVLHAFNPPLEIRIIEPMASGSGRKELTLQDLSHSRALMAQYNASKINANVPPPSSAASSTMETESSAARRILTSTRVSMASHAPRQKPLPVQAYYGLPPLPNRGSADFGQGSSPIDGARVRGYESDLNSPGVVVQTSPQRPLPVKMSTGLPTYPSPIVKPKSNTPLAMITLASQSVGHSVGQFTKVVMNRMNRKTHQQQQLEHSPTPFPPSTYQVERVPFSVVMKPDSGNKATENQNELGSPTEVSSMTENETKKNLPRLTIDTNVTRL